MHLISITTRALRNNIDNLINKIVNNYNNQNIKIEKSLKSDGDYQTIHFNIDSSNLENNNNFSDGEFLNIFKHYSAIAIVDYIVDTLEKEIVDKIFQTHYYYIKPDERKIIIDRFSNDLENEFHDKNIEVPYKVNKKAKILYKLLDFIAINEDINIEGFVKFRLKDYEEELKELLDRIVEEYMMEKEYNEFIKLLKYFVNIQEPKIEFLNIVVDKSGRYHFYDDKNKVIDDKYIKEIIDDLMDTDLNYDDLLISSLITIAPRKIAIHQSSNIKNQEILETIKNIFDKRVLICNNCRICNLTKYIKEE